MPKSRIVDLYKADRSAGAKARMLAVLHRHGFVVPPGLCIPFDGRERGDEPSVHSSLRAALATILDPSAAYAVRSSADIEDGPGNSFAGQFTTILDVRGADAVAEAVMAVRESAGTEAVRGYARRMGHGDRRVRMGVIVQTMVTPAYSGVAFSRNPTTGLHEVVVEAVPGRGDALVQQGVTPEHWVSRWGGWTTRPEGPQVPEPVIREVAEGARKIERRLGTPVDLEWVHDGKTLHWLQVRPITVLQQPDIYSCVMAREMLPGLIKPLIWSVNIPLVNGAWVRILTELIGPNTIDPMALARQFHYRAYFNIGAFGEIFASLGMPRESLEMLMGIEVEGGERPKYMPGAKAFRHLPRVGRFFWRNWRCAPAVERFVAETREAYRPFQEAETAGMPPPEIFRTIDRLFALNQRTAYYNILVPLLMQMYHRSFKGALRKGGVDYEQFDLSVEEARVLDPNDALARAHKIFLALPSELRTRIASGTVELLQTTQGGESLRDEIDGLLRKFGHLSNIGVDFSAVPWRETPDLVLRMVTTFTLPPAGTAMRLRFGDLPFTGMRRRWVRLLHDRARQFLLYRAQVGDLYTIGYGLFRKYYLALGDDLVRMGVLVSRDDVFYLTSDEIRELFGRASDGTTLTDRVARRRLEMEECRDARVPPIIFGDSAPPLKRVADGGLRGIPTSRGRYTGPVRVIRGMQEYERLRDGDVLVIPYSDVGLTPLFARAGAVVAESGGILSHSSIVAREYGIPAVVSVPGACGLADGVRVTVDGYTGEVQVLSPAGASRVEPHGSVS